MSPSSAAIVYASTPADPGHGAEQRDVAVVGAEPAQLPFVLADLAIQLVDQVQAGLDRPLPRLRESESGEELAAAHAEQVRDRARLAVGEQHGVHALLEARAVADQVETPTGALALRAHERVGEPDRRHQIA